MSLSNGVMQCILLSLPQKPLHYLFHKERKPQLEVKNAFGAIYDILKFLFLLIQPHMFFFLLPQSSVKRAISRQCDNITIFSLFSKVEI